ncbi:MAG TPA: hypothetical protein VFX78_12305 [Candidatus Eisenbacteria bacterium]|nr:hypothetical protein [Candidatus Eisenbacteria bacterium]
MKRILLMTALAALLVPAMLPAKSEAAVSVGVSFHVGDPYRGLSLHFQSAPDLALIPASSVYYVRNYDRDLYRYGRSWYYVEDNCWYQSSSYNGPFVRIAVSSVPRPIYNVPTRYRRAWGGPPSHAPAYGYHRNQGQDRNDNGWNRGGDRGSNPSQGGWQRNDDRRNDQRTDSNQRDRNNDRQRRDRRYVQDGRYGSR